MQHLRDLTNAMLRRAIAVLQIFATSQLGCGGPNDERFKRNVLKRSDKVNHWGDLRAKVELAINNVLEQAQVMEKEIQERLTWTEENHEDEVFEEEYHSDSEEVSSDHRSFVDYRFAWYDE